MKVINGDLIKLAREGSFDVIIHQCNCFHNFGAGIALQILKQYPMAFEADKRTSYGDRSKLGEISICSCTSKSGVFYIINGYSQFGCGIDRLRTEYSHVRSVFNKVKKHFKGKRMGYPLYGAGLAGGDWNIISKIIDEELDGEDHTLVKWER
jgi:O-acetyl-ADP-ribose deacetylase (regulator of RNase III)